MSAPTTPSIPPTTNIIPGCSLPTTPSGPTTSSGVGPLSAVSSSLGDHMASDRNRSPLCQGEPADQNRMTSSSARVLVAAFASAAQNRAHVYIYLEVTRSHVLRPRMQRRERYLRIPDPTLRAIHSPRALAVTTTRTTWSGFSDRESPTRSLGHYIKCHIREGYIRKLFVFFFRD